MRQKSITTSAFLLVLIALFYKNYQVLTEKAINFSNDIKSTIVTQKKSITDSISTHFNQIQQIEELKRKIKELEPKASLSVALGSKLNHLLKETDLTFYHPKLHLVQVLGYQRMQDKNRLWLEFPTFVKDKNYGLIYQGFTAGIIRESANQPLAILQSCKESLFSVFIGNTQIQGIAFGAGETIKIKYIPSYENPLVGDEVITSGNDKIFYEGIKVGTVTEIEKKDMYKIATVKPYVNPKQAHFFYAVEVTHRNNDK